MRRFLAFVLLTFAACGDPEPPSRIPVSTGAPDGSPCVSNAQCEGGFCIASFLGFPEGYCSSSSCSSDDDCSDGAVCLEFVDKTSACYASCSDGCRDGYACTIASDREVCAPTDLNLDEIVLPMSPFEQTLETLGANCEPESVAENRWRFEFVLSETATAVQFVPFVDRGEVLFETLETPSGALTRADYRHHNTRLEDVGIPGGDPFGTFGTVAFDWPVLVPFAPQFVDLIEPGGTYAVEVSTDGARPCLYTVESDGSGATVDLDIYIVTSSDLTAAQAGADPDFAEALAAADVHLGQAGIALGDVRFIDAAPDVAERFAIVRDLREIDLLAATGAPRTSDLDGHLTVDVFIVDSIIFDGITALGISAGVPGPAGMHGNLGNGLVFSAPDLGAGNAVVGQVLAHELSHYLGLRHTTELLNGAGTEAESVLDAEMGDVDPIADTPECSNVSREGSRCPDYGNLMFPALQSLPAGQIPGLTEGQAATLRRSPLVKP